MNEGLGIAEKAKVDLLDMDAFMDLALSSEDEAVKRALESQSEKPTKSY